MDDGSGSVRDRLGDNPFYVLELRPGCSRAEVEREGQRLLAMLELGLSKAQSYRTPVGERARTADQVRSAMAALRDPERRLLHELWARLGPDRDPSIEARTGERSDGEHDAARLGPWPAATAVLGWRRR